MYLKGQICVYVKFNVYFYLPVVDEVVRTSWVAVCMGESLRCFRFADETPCIEPWHFFTDSVNSCYNSEAHVLQKYYAF